MKINLLIIALLFSFNTFCQVDNFYTENSKIIWQKVFDDSLKINNLKRNLTLEFKDGLTGNIKNFRVSGKDLPLVFRSELIASFIIEDREDRYRVTVSNIRVIDRGLYDTSRFEREDAIEDYYLRRGEFYPDRGWTGKGWVAGRSAMNNFFTDLFNLNSDTSNDDW
jgi:hypothetical protein